MIGKLKIIVSVTHKLFPYFHSWYLWVFYRKEWEFISKRNIRKRKFSENPNYRLVDLVEITYKHKTYGYIRKSQYVI